MLSNNIHTNKTTKDDFKLMIEFILINSGEKLYFLGDKMLKQNKLITIGKQNRK
jgi:hypothetical protein